MIEVGEAQVIMGMPATVRVVGGTAIELDAVFDVFREADARFSTYQKNSEISRLNRGEISRDEYSQKMHDILARAEETRQQTDGFFDIKQPNGTLDPSGIVKGWAIRQAANWLRAQGQRDFFVDVGGDIQLAGRRPDGQLWRIGLRHPWSPDEVMTVLALPEGGGVATSGTYLRGNHVYNPHRAHQPAVSPVSLTVVGPDIYDADRFATAAFAMGRDGLGFIQRQGLEACLVTVHGKYLETPGFSRYRISEVADFTPR